MSRNTLNDALRFQKHLGNNTTCMICAIQQLLNIQSQPTGKSYSCMKCGEIVFISNNQLYLPPCADCGSKIMRF